MAVEGTAVAAATDGYCSVSDVQRLVQRVQFDASTKVTITGIEQFITEKFYEMNGWLRKAGLTVPIVVTATAALDILKRVNAYGAAALTERVLITAAVAQTGRAEDRGKVYNDLYEDWIQRILEFPGMLYDAPQGEVRLINSTEARLTGDADRVAFPESKPNELVRDHRQAIGGDGSYQVD